ncbi:MAG: energy-coupling factor transporter transmembrane protein EcfT [Candidatus Firestonebacteria bacterium]|nr:energy-coupling factor transporter transmembrane protein EcfT [Candidatus Firestonebacteria bacterium]
MSFYLYDDKKTIIHALDPRTKIFILFVSFILTLFFDHPIYILFTGSFILFYGLLSRALGNIKKVWFLIFVITVFTTISWSIFGRGQTQLWKGISYESFLYGLGASLKIDLMIVAGIIFLSTCKNEDVTLGLIKLGLPYAVSFSFGMALRLAPMFLETSSTIVEAQKSRGVNFDIKPFWKRFKSYFALLGPVLLTSIRHANGLAMALESKGFTYNQKRSFYINLKFKNKDFLIIIVLLIFFLINIYFLYKGRGKIEGLIL